MKAIVAKARPAESTNSPSSCWTALAAFAANFPLFLARRPTTPLRVLSVIAIDAALRGRRLALSPERRRAVVEVMELGALLNDHFDGDSVDRAELRNSVDWIANSPHRDLVRDYARRLRSLERARPSRGAKLEAIQRYREDVNRLSLATLWSLAKSTRLKGAEIEFQRETDLHLLFQIVMLTQVIDDIFDMRQDHNRDLPSFANAAGANQEMLRDVTLGYSHAEPDENDRDFSLKLALRLVAGCARAMISIRAAFGFDQS